MPTNRIALEAAFNFRDLGGIAARDGRRLRAGRAFRSDALHRLTLADVAKLEGLGVGVVFDLRSAIELERDGAGPIGRTLARHVHVPLVKFSLSPFDPTIDWRRLDLQNRYVEMLEEGGAAIAAVLGALADPLAPPVVFHCTGGKDRTGVVAAVLLRALGVADEDIVADYAVSESFLRPIVEGYREALAREGLDAAAVAYLTSSPPERMRHTLERLDARWGSIAGYLAGIGIDARALARLQANLLE